VERPSREKDMNTKEEKTRYIQTRDGEYEAQEQDKEQVTQRRMVNGCAVSPLIAGWDSVNQRANHEGYTIKHGIHQWGERKGINKKEGPRAGVRT
jgi:hypothetical protein